ncbi:RpiB/LacA/LacB family sugar-phosphate isomerase [Mycolicibacterium goodii]|uniref:RpiB/LacA/LacB family sugar-phosphate isomerase n=1 Tax=Mycolicibacterium goodii TaxID=134601 RepID=A0ABS6HLF3_MYCGD|nr:RpiB/LacA/LacB family sugar-phosphate isomerase [Mycolicibacterium goodii]OKH70517.1 ribose 5-phosphate isomerase [Mycobacterium sp. SWH-M5]MBU8811794.1 RpiB/LacA/LacB family sugar-phosphate isomerase [Mycolicibacterium goodii]MBU8814698.1 RpiB/LacA/LacB family sugar-phosphate isomerase [Mycolicibacterium goodii]MBU8822504.1 RpiB/LacA/LacB family sugar-phosphate isomerase [Mycolicibacterium goodii]MBU8829660.1 RpiB/LacA/LacB family sugar-phosphate isomerase [Mycolicibacterium goodii]
MHIAIAADHNAVPMKSRLSAWLAERGHETEDHGVHDATETVDYPPLCADIGSRVAAGAADFGIILGGSGCGEQIAANKIRGVRAALCHCVFTAEIARAHNDANVLVMGAKVVAPDLAERILAVWLATPFKGGRHQVRVDQISALESGDPLPQGGR